MKEKLYRKKNLEKMQNPDDLNDYFRTIEPAIWILIVALIILLIGAAVWAKALFYV